MIFKNLKQCFCDHDHEETVVATQEKFYDIVVLRDLYGKLAPPALPDGFIIADKIKTRCRKCGVEGVAYKKVTHGTDPTPQTILECKLDKIIQQLERIAMMR